MLVCRYCGTKLDFEMVRYAKEHLPQYSGSFRHILFCPNENCPVKPMTGEYGSLVQALESEEALVIGIKKVK